MRWGVVRVPLVAVAGLASILAAGCQSGDAGSVLSLGGKAAAPDTDSSKVKLSDLRGYCPKVTLRDTDAVLNVYAKGGQDDPAKLLYQASISDVTRSCSHANGTLSITVAVAGKVVPGPAAVPGTVTLPLRITALQGDEQISSQLYQQPVQLADANSAVQFVIDDSSLNIPEPQQPDLRIYAGYELAPPKPEKKTGKKGRKG